MMPVLVRDGRCKSTIWQLDLDQKGIGNTKECVNSKGRINSRCVDAQRWDKRSPVFSRMTSTGGDFAPGYPVILEARDRPRAAQEFDQRRSPFAPATGADFAPG
jgi:hypothetical protein